MKTERNFLIGSLVVAAVLGMLLQNDYLLHILVLVLLYSILASSLNLIVGYVGEFPLGHVAFFGLGAYSVAILSSPSVGMSVTLAVCLSAVIAAIAGWLIGRITLRLSGPFFVIVTLAFAEVLRLLANNWIALTNGPMGISGVQHPAILDVNEWLSGKRGFVMLGVVLAAITFYICYRLVYSSAGRAAVTLRENNYVAQSIGIDPFRYSLFVFVVAAFLAGIAGAYYATYISFVGPEVFGFPFTATMIIIVLLGGKGTLIGPVLGAVLVTLLEEYLREFKEVRLSLFGLIVVAMVLFAPDGVMGYVRQRFSTLFKRVRHA
ncbi:branched-chain amino acid ABC transporter permease [Paenalcaligenes niemegkensis]|uniref:branched-chain amino acid ABC transporter permease n=1 Tax=Paenalcaligenes niemegkensis TaxID=2895469 RepID=UPI001EE864AF|nr:branched-chain amino acid ABC transporter permease [Paenalcaligenes niemegkensis]MCQ9617654.1 branched-chain amino acid ABC transporter permease [Paenalcaligenes niemegkensis]